MTQKSNYFIRTHLNNCILDGDVKRPVKHFKFINILDKELSVDEGSLITPLEPLRATFEESSIVEPLTTVDTPPKNIKEDLELIHLEERSEYTKTKTLLEKSLSKLDSHICTTSTNVCLVKTGECQVLASILRRESVYDSDRKSINDCDMQPMTPRKVSFPDDEEVMVTYREPEYQNHWSIGTIKY